MIKAIALDDEPPALKILDNFCSRIDYIDLQKTFTRTEEAFEFLKNNQVDLLFLDINMPSITGIDFYKRLPEKIMVVFTTAFAEFAVEGFNLKAVDYLLKPFTYDRFLQSAEKAKEMYDFQKRLQTEATAEYIFLRIDYGMVKIFLNDILFIEGLDDYLKIHFNNQKPLIARLTMKALLEKLPAKEFIRVHRSYIISIKHIDSVRNKMIFIGGEEIPIGNSYEAAFTAFFNK